MQWQCLKFQMEDIKLDVQHAREAPTEHPQWEFEDEDEENNSKADESEDQVKNNIYGKMR